VGLQQIALTDYDAVVAITQLGVNVLTTELGALRPGMTVIAAGFGVAQSASTGDIVIAQVVHSAEENQDYLYVLTGLSNAPGAAWLHSPANRQWLARPYDKRPLLWPMSTSPTCISKPRSPRECRILWPVSSNHRRTAFKNFTVNLDPSVSSGVWQEDPTAQNYDQLVGMALGMAQSSLYVGLYELYTLSGETAQRSPRCGRCTARAR
jgi:hypothetical protein